MRISAKADYAVRAVVELAAASGEKPVKAERIATAQEIPLNFLENILGELRHAGIVRSHRGAEGGFRLARPADRGDGGRRDPCGRGPARQRPRRAARGGRLRRARPRRCPRVWIAVRANLRAVRRARHRSPTSPPASCRRSIDKLAEDPDAWVMR